MGTGVTLLLSPPGNRLASAAGVRRLRSGLSHPPDHQNNWQQTANIKVWRRNIRPPALARLRVALRRRFGGAKTSVSTEHPANGSFFVTTTRTFRVSVKKNQWT